MVLPLQLTLLCLVSGIPLNDSRQHKRVTAPHRLQGDGLLKICIPKAQMDTPVGRASAAAAARAAGIAGCPTHSARQKDGNCGCSVGYQVAKLMASKAFTYRGRSALSYDS